MTGSILGMLAEHRSLAYEQIAAMLDEPSDAVRRELELNPPLTRTAWQRFGYPDHSDWCGSTG
jgi:hypothetical protein